MTQPPAQPYGYYPPPRPRYPKEIFTPWSTRAGAFLIDWAPIWGLFVIFLGALFKSELDCAPGAGAAQCNSFDVNLIWVELGSLLLAAIFFLWNLCYREGKTGRSIGKSGPSARWATSRASRCRMSWVRHDQRIMGSESVKTVRGGR